MVIDNFHSADYNWLSNFYTVDIKLSNIVFASVEHAYQSQKNFDISWLLFCSDSRNSASKVKRKSKNITIRSDWDLVKISIMNKCLLQKFNQEPFRTYLINTGDSEIIEKNEWNDRYWGVDIKTNIGENFLGKLIMNIRFDLQHNK